MTITKQRAVCSMAHALRLRDYLDDGRAIARDTQNIARPEKWFDEMSETRELAGHDEPSRKGAKNILILHQVLAFLPEALEQYGGKLSPKLCMEYAREYAQIRYPHQQILFVEHRERCKADGTERIAVHMAICITDTETMRRLDEGRPRAAMRKRVETVRRLDREWGLPQVEKGKVNSHIHRQQPRGVERAMIERGALPFKTALRNTCNRVLQNARSMNEFRALLESEGVTTRIKNGKIYATDRAHAKHEFSLSRLDAHLNTNLLKTVFARGDGLVQNSMGTMSDALSAKGASCEKEIGKARAEYIRIAKERYAGYAERVKTMRGKPVASIPTFKLPRPPKAIRDDAEVQRCVLACARKAEKLRRQVSADGVPRKPRNNRTSTVASYGQREQQRRPVEQERVTHQRQGHER